MKLDMPALPETVDLELRQWVERVVQLINAGYYTPKLFTTTPPTLGQMGLRELATGAGTGAGGEHEVFVKVNSTTIARFKHYATIT